MVTEKIDDLDSLGLDKKLANNLRFNGVTQVAQLHKMLAKGDSTILKLTNIAKGGLSQIKVALGMHGAKHPQSDLSETATDTSSAAPANKPKKTTGRKAQGKVTTQKVNNLTGKKDRPEVEEKKLGEGHYDQPTANVGFSMGFTLPTNTAYESVKVEASLHMPCYVEEIKKVQPMIRDMVENWLGEAVTNVKVKLGIIETPGDQPEPKAPDTSPEAQGSAEPDIAPWEITDSSETPQTTAPEASDEVPDEARTDASLFDDLGIE